MQIRLADFLSGTTDGEDAAELLQKCVHCGFCNATCPTYQLLGDELDGPRGRIYLLKQAFEGQPITATTQRHLDRCLQCGGCETACPAGVEYGRLLDIGRRLLEQRVPRPRRQRLVRWALRQGMPRRRLFGAALRLGRLMRSLLPRALRDKLPAAEHPMAQVRPWPQRVHARKMLLLDGCVQPALRPGINAAAARVLDRLGVQLVCAQKAACCGAIRHHLSDADGALADIRRNVDVWEPALAQGAEALAITAAGCGAVIREYGYLLRRDPAYAERARRVSALTRDLSEVLLEFVEPLRALTQARVHSVAAAAAGLRVAYHPPCSLQHSQKVRGSVERLLGALGIDVQLPSESHLCCGAAGTYALLQPELASALRDRKLAHLQALASARILSANIGCILHLQSSTPTPVQHWIELLDELMS